MLIPRREPLPEAAKQEWRELGLRTRLAAARRGRIRRQEDLAVAIGVSVATLREIEAGRIGARVSIGTLLACASVLELPLSALIEDEWLEEAERLEPLIDRGKRLDPRDTALKMPTP